MNDPGQSQEKGRGGGGQTVPLSPPLLLDIPDWYRRGTQTKGSFKWLSTTNFLCELSDIESREAKLMWWEIHGLPTAQKYSNN